MSVYPESDVIVSLVIVRAVETAIDVEVNLVSLVVASVGGKLLSTKNYTFIHS